MHEIEYKCTSRQIEARAPRVPDDGFVKRLTGGVPIGVSMPRNVKIDAEGVLARALREGPDGLLTRGEAAALIALRARDPRDTDRTARNRAALMLDRACERGSVLHHGGLPRQADGRFRVNDVAYLAQCKFPDLFTDLPCRPPEVCLSVHDGFSVGGSAEHEYTPADLKACQALIDALRTQIRQLHADRQHAEIERKRELTSRFKGKKDK